MGIKIEWQAKFWWYYRVFIPQTIHRIIHEVRYVLRTVVD